jgi:hypothetical protein
MRHCRSSHRDSYCGHSDGRDSRDGRDGRAVLTIAKAETRDQDRGRGASNDKDRDRDPYGRDSCDRDRNWCRSPPPPRHSPDYPSYSRSPLVRFPLTLVYAHCPS